MKGFRFSLGSMFAGVAVVSLACAALVKPTWYWAIAVQAITLSILTVALLAALVYERGAARAFWIGFAVIGWGNLGIQRLHLSEVSLTGEVSEWLKNVIHPGLDPYGAALDAAAVADVDTASPAPPRPAAFFDVEAARNAFPYLVVWIWPPVFGFVGAVVAQQLYFRWERLAVKQSPSGSGPT